MRALVLSLILLFAGLVPSGAGAAQSTHATLRDGCAFHDRIETTGSRGTLARKATLKALLATTSSRWTINERLGSDIEPVGDDPFDLDGLDKSPEVIRLDEAPPRALVPYRSPFHADLVEAVPELALQTLLRPPARPVRVA